MCVSLQCITFNEDVYFIICEESSQRPETSGGGRDRVTVQNNVIHIHIIIKMICILKAKWPTNGGVKESGERCGAEEQKKRKDIKFSGECKYRSTDSGTVALHLKCFS